jgi:ATP-binding cassette subfamily B protein
MVLKKANKNKRNWFIDILKKDIKLLIITITLGLIASSLGMAIAVFSQKLIDTIIPSHNLNNLFIGLCIAASILLIKIIVTYTQQYTGAKYNQQFNMRLIDEFFRNLLLLPKSFFDSHSTGVLIARMNDSSSIQQTITYVANTLILNALILIVSIVVMFFYSAKMSLMVLVALPIFLTIAFAYKKKVVRNITKVMEANAKKESNYISTIQNIDLLKTHNKEEMFTNINHEMYGDYQKRILRSTMTGASIGAVAELSGTFLFILMLSYSSYQMIIGNLTVGEFTAAITIATGMFGPIATLGFAILQLQGARVAFDRMYEFITLDPEYDKNEDETKLNLEKITNIELKNIYFSYQNEKIILNDLSFMVNKGEMLCIFGRNGSGKTTILKLLMYLYRPGNGDIKFNGTDIKDISIQGFRKKIAIVAQQSKLFDRTVIENICLDSDYMETETAIHFLNGLGFDKYINTLDQGYNTMINENGENLSGGQKQIISLARALCKKPDVLLLDEPTASMDEEAEAFVIETLKKFKANGIVIIVTHKRNPAKESDKIVILKNGAFQDQGTHQELVLAKNLYSESFLHQEYNEY